MYWLVILAYMWVYCSFRSTGHVFETLVWRRMLYTCMYLSKMEIFSGQDPYLHQKYVCLIYNLFWYVFCTHIRKMWIKQNTEHLFYKISSSFLECIWYSTLLSLHQKAFNLYMMDYWTSVYVLNYFTFWGNIDSVLTLNEFMELCNLFGLILKTSCKEKLCYAISNITRKSSIYYNIL